MTVIWVPNAVRGSPQLTGDDGPHCSLAAHPSGPPWFDRAEAGLAGLPPVRPSALPHSGQFSSVPRGTAQRGASHCTLDRDAFPEPRGATASINVYKRSCQRSTGGSLAMSHSITLLQKYTPSIKAPRSPLIKPFQHLLLCQDMELYWLHLGKEDKHR